MKKMAKRYRSGCGPWGGLDEYDKIVRRAKQYFRDDGEFVMCRGNLTWTSMRASAYDDVRGGSMPGRIMYRFVGRRWLQFPGQEPYNGHPPRNV